MKKTIKQWFEETLPKEVAELAIEITLELRGEERLQERGTDFQEAMACAFAWDESPQGSDFWETIYDSNGKTIPELPKTN